MECLLGIFSLIVLSSWVPSNSEIDTSADDVSIYRAFIRLCPRRLEYIFLHKVLVLIVGYFRLLF